MWRNLKIGKKIALGMFSILFLLSVVAIASILAINNSASGFKEYRGLARDTNLAGRLQANMLMVRMNVKDFQITGSQKDKDQYKEYMDKMRGFLATAQEEIQNPERAKLIDMIEEEQQTYDENFQKIIQFRKDRDELVYKVLNVQGPQIEKNLTAIMTSAYADKDPVAAFKGGITLRSLLLARLYQAKFLDTNAEADRDRVLAEFEIMQDTMKELDAELQNPQRRKLLGDTQDRTEKYKTAFVSLTKVIFDRNEIQKGTLDVIGPMIAQESEDVKLSVMADQDKLGPRLTKANNSALITIIILSAVAIISALIITPLIILGITKPIKKINDRLVDLASGDGDLTLRVNANSRDELGVMGNNVDEFLSQMHRIIADVKQASEEVASAAGEIASNAEQMSRGVDEQNSQTRLVSAAIEEMTATTQEVASKASSAAGTAGEAGQQAVSGGDVVSETVTGMHEIAEVVMQSAQSVTELGERSEKIGDIISVINEIADQTNLLALNAAIEAARAGDHGRGFAVVADEVRQLAERTAKATQEVSESIKTIQEGTKSAVTNMETGAKSVEHGVVLATKAGDSLGTIVEGSRDVAGMIEAIAASAEEQSAAAEEISRNVESIAAISNQTAQGVQQSAAAALQLSNKSESLLNIVGQFKL